MISFYCIIFCITLHQCYMRLSLLSGKYFIRELTESKFGFGDLSVLGFFAPTWTHRNRTVYKTFGNNTFLIILLNCSI